MVPVLEWCTVWVHSILLLDDQWDRLQHPPQPGTEISSGEWKMNDAVRVKCLSSNS